MAVLRRSALAGIVVGFCAASLTAQNNPTSKQDAPVMNDIPQAFTVPAQPVVEAPKVEFDYVKRVEMVPMRDGVKLYTVIVIPKDATHAPIMLTRTPYNAEGAGSGGSDDCWGCSGCGWSGTDGGRNAVHEESPHMLDELGLSDEIFVKNGYIRCTRMCGGSMVRRGSI